MAKTKTTRVNPTLPAETYQNLRDLVSRFGPRGVAKRLGFNIYTVRRLVAPGGAETRVLRSTIAKIDALARDVRTKNMPSGSLTDEQEARRQEIEETTPVEITGHVPDTSSEKHQVMILNRKLRELEPKLAALEDRLHNAVVTVVRCCDTCGKRIAVAQIPITAEPTVFLPLRCPSCYTGQ